MTTSMDNPEGRDQAGDRPQPPASDYARRDRRLHVRCSAKGSDSTRSTCWSWCSNSNAVFGVDDRRRTDRHEGAALRRHDRRLHHQRAGETARRDEPATRNVFTVDLEEWFHICGVGGAARGLSTGIGCRRASSRPRGSCSICSIALNVRATLFVVGWVAERHPRLIEACGRPGTKSDRTAIATSAPTISGPTPSAPIFARASAPDAAGVRSRVTMFRAPEWSINDRSLWALDTLAGKGSRVDASMAPVRIVGDGHVSALSSYAATPAPGRSSKCRRSSRIGSGQVMPMGWGWGLRMSSPRRVLRAIEAVNRTGRARGPHASIPGSSIPIRRGCGFRLVCISPTTSG